MGDFTVGFYDRDDKGAQRLVHIDNSVAYMT